jgi:hypothetical protein
MDNVFQAIKETVFEESQTHYPLPSLCHTAVDLFGKAHLYYRTFKRYTLFQRVQNVRNQGHPAIYGAALHLISDYSTIGSYALKVVLITKCAEDLLHQYQRLYQAYLTLQQTICRHFPVHQRIKWHSSLSQNSLLSPSFQLWWKIEVKGFIQQILKVIECAFYVLKEAFKLSMCLRDIYLLTNGDPETKYEAFTELVVDWERYQKQLQEDQAFVYQELAQKCLLADRILTKLHIDKRTTFIFSRLENGIRVIGQTMENYLPDMQQVGKQTLESVLPIGKVASLQIDLAEGQNFISTLPIGRYPPWGGQAIEIKSIPQKNASIFLTKQEHLPMTENDPFAFTNCISHVFQFAQQVCQTWQEKI